MLEVFHTDRITVVLYSSMVDVTVKQVVADRGLLRLGVEGHQLIFIAHKRSFDGCITEGGWLPSMHHRSHDQHPRGRVASQHASQVTWPASKGEGGFPTCITGHMTSIQGGGWLPNMHHRSHDQHPRGGVASQHASQVTWPASKGEGGFPACITGHMTSIQGGGGGFPACITGHMTSIQGGGWLPNMHHRSHDQHPRGRVASQHASQVTWPASKGGGGFPACITGHMTSIQGGGGGFPACITGHMTSIQGGGWLPNMHHRSHDQHPRGRVASQHASQVTWPASKGEGGFPTCITGHMTSIQGGGWLPNMHHRSHDQHPRGRVASQHASQVTWPASKGEGGFPTCITGHMTSIQGGGWLPNMHHRSHDQHPRGRVASQHASQVTQNTWSASRGEGVGFPACITGLMTSGVCIGMRSVRTLLECFLVEKFVHKISCRSRLKMV